PPGAVSILNSFFKVRWNPSKMSGSSSTNRISLFILGSGFRRRLAPGGQTGRNADQAEVVGVPGRGRCALGGIGLFPDQDVGGVNAGQRTENRLGSAGRAVMERDRFDDGHGQTPQTDQITADIGVIGAEDLLF